MTGRRKPSDGAAEPRVSSARLQDLPGYQEMAGSAAFKEVQGARVTSAPRVLVQQRWIATCDACGAIEPERGPLESQDEAAEVRQRHLDEHARGEWA